MLSAYCKFKVSRYHAPTQTLKHKSLALLSILEKTLVTWTNKICDKESPWFDPLLQLMRLPSHHSLKLNCLLVCSWFSRLIRTKTSCNHHFFQKYPIQPYHRPSQNNFDYQSYLLPCMTLWDTTIKSNIDLLIKEFWEMSTKSLTY